MASRFGHTCGQSRSRAKKKDPGPTAVGRTTQEDAKRQCGNQGRSPVPLGPRLFFASWICAAGLVEFSVGAVALGRIGIAGARPRRNAPGSGPQLLPTPHFSWTRNVVERPTTSAQDHFFPSRVGSQSTGFTELAADGPARSCEDGTVP
jgi:hypothetical protein